MKIFKYSFKKGLVFVLLVALYTTADAQLQYEDVFGSNWVKANAFEKENREWMKKILRQNKIPYSEAIAVIFPELVRYSALRDKMEITLLKALYINLGEDYADFSIGQLQMKPSFASEIRAESAEYLKKRSGINFKSASDFDNIRNYRKSIVTELEDVKTEFSYLIAFYKICERKFRTSRMDTDDRVRFLSTAYNFGIDKDPEQINKISTGRYFHTKIFKPDDTYNYSDISLYWYNKFSTD